MDRDNPNQGKVGTNEASKNSGLEFEDSGWRAIKYYREPATPKIIELIVKYSGGLIKDVNQARYFLLSFVVIAMIISLYLLLGQGDTTGDIINRPSEF